MACRICPDCDRHWPVRNAHLICAYCGCQTGWSGAEPTTTQADERHAEQVAEKVKALGSDLAELERYAAGSARLLSFPIAINRWPIAPDVPGPFIEGGAGGEPFQHHPSPGSESPRR